MGLDADRAIDDAWWRSWCGRTAPGRSSRSRSRPEAGRVLPPPTLLPTLRFLCLARLAGGLVGHDLESRVDLDERGVDQLECQLAVTAVLVLLARVGEPQALLGGDERFPCGRQV